MVNVILLEYKHLFLIGKLKKVMVLHYLRGSVNVDTTL